MSNSSWQGEIAGPRGLRHLLEATLTVTSALDLPVLLRRLVEMAVDLSGATYGALGVLDPARAGLAEFITVGVDDQTRERIGDLPKGRGLLGSLISNARPLRLADLHEHPESAGFPPGHPPMTSFLGVPIQVGGEAFGNLYLTDKTTGEVFTDVDEELVRGLASAAAVAIHNAQLVNDLHRREAALAAVAEVATSVAAGRERADTLQLVARRARELLDADLATIATPDPAGQTLIMEVVDGPLGTELAGQRFPVADSISGEVLRSGEMISLADASGDPRIAQPQVNVGGLGPAVWTALFDQGRPFGTLGIDRHAGATPFSTAELDLVRTFASQASLVIEHDRVRRDAHRLTLIEDQERIARDLHDTVIQRVFAAGMALQSALHTVTDDRARERISGVISDLDITIREIRSAIFGLEVRRSATGQGVRAETLRLAAEAARMLGFEPQVRFDGALDTGVVDPVAEDLLAIVRESLSNVARHARASRVLVDLTLDGDIVMLRVEDDGIGIDPKRLGGGNGMANMHARAKQRGGNMTVEPRSGGGTVLAWRCLTTG